MHFRLEVRITPEDIGARVVVRWRRPAVAGAPEVVTDVLGILEAADDGSFVVRTAAGEAVTIPRDRALAAKTIPARPAKTPREVPPGR